MVYDYKITCVICKKKVHPRLKNQITCGDEYCKTKRGIQISCENYRKKVKLIYFNKSCQNCGKVFQGSSSKQNQIYCSKGCRLQYNKKTYIERVKNGQIAMLKLRFEVLKRDGFSCQYCGRSPKENKVTLHVDHIIPRNKGGKDNYDNLITSCSDCNYGKTDVLLSKKDFEV